MRSKGQKGFTILEVLITMAVLVALATAGWGSYLNYSNANSLETVQRGVVSDLRSAREKALSGESFLNWGIHFDGTNNNYALFSSPTDFSDAGKSIISTTYLSNGVTFSSPGPGATEDVIFNKISGTSTAATITLAQTANTGSITINSLGAVY